MVAELQEVAVDTVLNELRNVWALLRDLCPMKALYKRQLIVRCGTRDGAEGSMESLII